MNIKIIDKRTGEELHYTAFIPEALYKVALPEIGQLKQRITELEKVIEDNFGVGYMGEYNNPNKRPL